MEPSSRVCFLLCLRPTSSGGGTRQRPRGKCGSNPQSRISIQAGSRPVFITARAG
ncbi:hypothetical protein PR001_g19294 [Phytophthora rubi]|uniref:Uncharacterized protein n=1 Tax=Phytophthora rubi TaxID=129364 RepID=A0A6A3JYV5_9STRA|nr:hypothetical protein PR001_g19294 [Phytophthora rubi]